MTISLLFAWRNLWRHRRRTWLTIAAMVFCNTLLVFLIALQLGSYQMMIDNTLSLVTGHLQVQHQAYQEEEKMRQVVPGAAALAAQLRGREDISAAAARGVAYVLASSEQRSFGVQLSGVQPDREPGVSTWPSMLREGRYLADPRAAEVVVGAVLARNLKLSVGDELVFLGSGLDGSFAAGVLTLVGIVETGIADLDRALAQVPLAYFQEAFAMGTAAHLVVARTHTPQQAGPVAASLRRDFALAPELAVRDWDALQPGLREAIQSDMVSAWFMYAVLIVLVALSVLNTQLMSVLERTREFGVMLALGLRPRRLAALVALEAGLMALVGLLLGVLCGALVVAYYASAGFSYPGMAEAAARFNLPPRIYPEVSALALLWGPVTVFAGALLAAVYPALRLFRMQPVAAMRAV